MDVLDGFGLFEEDLVAASEIASRGFRRDEISFPRGHDQTGEPSAHATRGVSYGEIVKVEIFRCTPGTQVVLNAIGVRNREIAVVSICDMERRSRQANPER